MKHPGGDKPVGDKDKRDKNDLLFKKILTISLIAYFTVAIGITLIPYDNRIKKDLRKPSSTPVEIHLKNVPSQLSEELKKRLAEEQKKKKEAQKKLIDEKRLAEENRKKEEQARLAKDKKKAEEQKQIEEGRKKAEEQKRKEEEKRRLAEQKKKDDEKKLTEQRKRGEEEKKAVKEQNKAVAANTGLLKTMKGGGGRFADNIVNTDEINSAISAPSLKGSGSRSPGGTTRGQGQVSSQGKGLKGSAGIGDVTASIPTKQTGGLSGRRGGDGGIDTKLAGKGDMGSGGKGSPKTRSQGAIKEVLTSHRGSIDFIYRKALRDNPALKGTVVIEFTIAPSGEIVSARIVSSTVKDQAFEQQVLKRIQTWKFPPFPESGNTVIKYPLEFEPA